MEARAEIDNGRVIRREKTAIRRYRCSRPIALALADGLIGRETAVFDYGCGLGGDVQYLRARGVRVSGWDPHHLSKAKLQEADIVNLGYVLNVIEEQGERTTTLRQAFQLARRILVVAVRVDRALDDAEQFGDGLLTGRGTFQKLYSQEEFRNYVEAALGFRLHVASLGVGYVFKDQEAEAKYVANKAFTRRLEYRTDLIEEFAADSVARRFVRLAVKLGRLPLPEEFRDYHQLCERYGSPQRLTRLTLARVNRDEFEGSRAQRREDILTYLAMLRLQGITPPPVGVLPSTVRGDIKGIWGSYAAAQAEGERFLFRLGNPADIRRAAEVASVGKRLPEDLYVHVSAQDELPALLRLMIFAAQQVVGEVQYDVAKLSLDGRAVSFLRYRQFDEEPHPELELSLRVYLPKASFGVRDYRGHANAPILHRKDTLVTPSYSRFDEFKQLTETEERLGLLSSPVPGFREGWETLVAARGLSLDGHRLVQRRLNQSASVDFGNGGE